MPIAVKLVYCCSDKCYKLVTVLKILVVNVSCVKDMSLWIKSVNEQLLKCDN